MIYWMLGLISTVIAILVFLVLWAEQHSKEEQNS